MEIPGKHHQALLLKRCIPKWESPLLFFVPPLFVMLFKMRIFSKRCMKWKGFLISILLYKLGLEVKWEIVNFSEHSFACFVLFISIFIWVFGKDFTFNILCFIYMSSAYWFSFIFYYIGINKSIFCVSPLILRSSYKKYWSWVWATWPTLKIKTCVETRQFYPITTDPTDPNSTLFFKSYRVRFRYGIYPPSLAQLFPKSAFCVYMIIYLFHLNLITFVIPVF